MAGEPEVVDLTDSPPPERAPKRARSPPAATPAAAPPAVAADEEAAQRRRAQDSARSVPLPRAGAAAAAAQPEREPPSELGGGLGGGAAARERAMRAAAARATAAARAPLAAARAAAPPVAAANASLAALAAERRARRGSPPPAGAPAAAPAAPRPQRQAPPPEPAGPPRAAILSYNVWFREDVACAARLDAVGGVIAAAGHPELVALQEVTPAIFNHFSRAPWFRLYDARPTADEVLAARAAYFTCLLWRRDAAAPAPGAQGGGYSALPFENSVMGRDLKAARLLVRGAPLTVATAHLESPAGWQRPFSEERKVQATEALAALDAVPGPVVFVGDANWNEKNDGAAPLPPGWTDLWEALRPGEPGYSYDAVENAMLARPGRRARPLRLRLDRAWARLAPRWRVASVELVGKEAVPGVAHEGRPVLPSDHYGLLLRLEQEEGVRGEALGGTGAGAGAAGASAGTDAEEATRRRRLL
jgi:tyrosyl-DNA phosphodiesterase 2